MIPTACSDLFKRTVDRWSRFVVRRHRWLLLAIVLPLAFGGWAFGSGIEIDYGINAFKVRDHPAAANLDSMNAAVVQYHELANEFRTQLKKLGLKKRSLVDNDAFDWRDRVLSASELAHHGFLDGLETPAAIEADDDVVVVGTRKRAKEAQRVRNQWHLHVILEVPDDTVFRADVLHFAKDLQARITELPSYDDFCWVPTSARGFCSQPESLLPIFYPTRVSDGDSADSRPLGAQLTDIESGINTVLRYGIYYYTDKQFSSTNKRSTLFRIQFQFGSPLPGFDNYRDRYNEQEELFGSWAMANLHPLLRDLDTTAVPGLRVFYGGDGLTEREILSTLISDASFASFSLLCIFGLLWLNTDSLFVALISTFEIAVSVPFVYWMYRIVGGIRYLGVLNAISLFLILGIGVDDCLIFYNTFMQLAHLPDTAERLSITYRRATKATFITSFTTAAAFAVNLNSAIPALRLFAIFMSLLVVANWLLVVSWFPAALVFWHERARHWHCVDSCLRALRLRRRAAAASDGGAASLVANDEAEAAAAAAESGGVGGADTIDLEPAPTLKSKGDSVLRKRITSGAVSALAGACALGIAVGIVGASDVALVTGAVCGAVAAVLGALTWAYVPQRVRATARTLHRAHILDAALYGLLAGMLIAYVVLAEVWAAALAGLGVALLFTCLAALRHRIGPHNRARYAVLLLRDYENDEALPAHYRNSEKFFHQHFAPFVVRWSWILLITFGCLIVASGWRASKLRQSEDLPQFFSRTSNLQRFIDWRVGGYYKDGSYSVSQLPVKYGCDKIADSGKVEDLCGVCGGDCTTCVASCDGVGNRTCAEVVIPDACKVCGGDNSTCGMGLTTTTTAQMSSLSSSMMMTMMTMGTLSPTPQPTPESTTIPTTTTTTATTTPVAITTTPTTSTSTGSSTMCVLDKCGVCGGTNLCVGCDDEPNSGKTYDSCGVCAGGDACVGCDGEVGSGKVVDMCGVCGGSNQSCTDCNGVLHGSSVRDRCGKCDGDGSSCAGTPPPTTQPPTPVPTGCDGIALSPKRVDMCGVCGGRNACLDCDGVAYGTRKLDDCGVCGGDGSSCRGGCDGKGHTVDKCGVCGGGNACLGCDGSFNTTKKYDACGKCDGTNECLPIKPISANLNSLYVTWGLQGIDRSKADINNPFDSYLGDPIYDAEFEFEDPMAQLAVENLTNTLVESSALVEAGHERNFFPQLRTWLRQQSMTPFPIPRAFNASVVLARFIYANPSFDSYIGFRVYPLRVSFVRVRVLSKVDSGTSSAKAAEQWDAFQEVIDKANRRAPRTARSAEQASDIWIRVFTEVVAVNGIINGVILTGVVSVVCLAFFTGNVIVSLLAVFSIGGNLIVMMALYELWEWTLGAIEAISVSILVGLSVDYCFHLAEAYAISRKQTRVARVVDAMTHMGISVVGGALTTAASALFLLFCQIEIFHKFGVIVVVNTFFSVVFTFFFFCALLATIGPTGHWGDIGYGVRWCRNTVGRLFGRPAAYQSVYVANTDNAADGGLMDEVQGNSTETTLRSSKPPVLPVVVLE